MDKFIWPLALIVMSVTWAVAWVQVTNLKYGPDDNEDLEDLEDKEEED